MDQRFTEEPPDTPPASNPHSTVTHSRQAQNSGKSQPPFYLNQESSAHNAQFYQQGGHHKQQESYEDSYHQSYQQTVGQPYSQSRQSQNYTQSHYPYQQTNEGYSQSRQSYHQATDQPNNPYSQSDQTYQSAADSYPQINQNYQQTDPYHDQYPSPYQPSQHVNYQQQPLSSDRDEEEYRFVSSRLADVEEASEPLIKSSDLIKPGVATQHRPGSEEADLRREIAYQEQMRQRLLQQQQEFAQMPNVVPPLNLSHASTPREEGARDSLDISLRSDSEEDAMPADFDPAEYYKQGHPHMPSHGHFGAPQRLSAQHRAEMAHVLSSLGNVNRHGADLAIDKDLYDSSRHARDSDVRKEGSGAQELENVEFLMKIHAYNRALQQRAQEDAWNDRAAAHAAAAANNNNGKPANQKRANENAAPRLGQSAPPEANNPKKPGVLKKGRRRNTAEDLNATAKDFVTRNKRITEQRGPQKGYTDRYKQKQTKTGEAENSGLAPNMEANEETSQRALEHHVAFATRQGAVLAPISVPVTVPLPPEFRSHGEALTFDVNVRVQAGPDPRSQGSEREQEWAFVHDPENVFNPPSPRARFKVSPSHQQRQRFDSQVLQEHLHRSGILPQQTQQRQMRSPPTKYPPLPPISRQPENEEARRPLETRNQENTQHSDSGYLDIFRGSADRKPQYKKYTLREFKNLRNIAALGGLGPDFESEAFRQQQERRMRRRQYGDQIERRNQEEIAKSPKRPPPEEESKQRKFVHPSTEIPSKHQLMKEYVKTLESRPDAEKSVQKRSKEPQAVVQPKEKRLSLKVIDTKALNEILNDAEHERLKKRHEEERFAQERIRAHNNTAAVHP